MRDASGSEVSSSTNLLHGLHSGKARLEVRQVVRGVRAAVQQAPPQSQADASREVTRLRRPAKEKDGLTRNQGCLRHLQVRKVAAAKRNSGDDHRIRVRQ